MQGLHSLSCFKISGNVLHQRSEKFHLCHASLVCSTVLVLPHMLPMFEICFFRCLLLGALSSV